MKYVLIRGLKSESIMTPETAENEDKQKEREEELIRTRYAYQAVKLVGKN